jgi:CheY-like chemotaxis protein
MNEVVKPGSGGRTFDWTSSEVLPLDAGAPAPFHPAQSSPTGARILHADDEDCVRSVCRAVLTRAGHTVVTVADGAAAWQALSQGGFDLVITDHHMPHLTGLELLAKMREHNIDVPVIVTTGSVECYRGFDQQGGNVSAVLEKPFTIERLRAAVLGALSAGALRRTPA